MLALEPLNLDLPTLDDLNAGGTDHVRRLALGYDDVAVAEMVRYCNDYRRAFDVYHKAKERAFRAQRALWRRVSAAAAAPCSRCACRLVTEYREAMNAIGLRFASLAAESRIMLHHGKIVMRALELLRYHDDAFPLLDPPMSDQAHRELRELRDNANAVFERGMRSLASICQKDVCDDCRACFEASSEIRKAAPLRRQEQLLA